MKLEGHPRLIIGPRVGEDAAVIELGDRYLVAKSDPVTFVEGRIGWYAVHVNANDIACMGAQPFWFLMTLLLPENLTDEKMVETIWADVRSACKDLGITLCGGHTEITQGLDRPILCGQMLGEVNKERLVRGDGAQPGDVILGTYTRNSGGRNSHPGSGEEGRTHPNSWFRFNRSSGKLFKGSRNQRSSPCSRSGGNWFRQRNARSDGGRSGHWGARVGRSGSAGRPRGERRHSDFGGGSGHLFDPRH